MFTHQHEQTVASTDWVIDHGLGFKPCTEVFVTENGVVQSILPKAIEYPSTSRVIVRFTSARTGSARLV